MMGIIARLIASGTLIWALSEHEYTYLMILRWIVCGVAIYCTFLANNQKNKDWTWIFGGIAVLFNPIIPIHLNRKIWNAIDIIVAVIFLISIFIVKKKKIKSRKVTGNQE
jgi:uncharacterized membrane protein